MSPSPEQLPTSAFDYPLPAELIARFPADRRDESRLLVVDRASGALSHRVFRDIAHLIPAGDALVLNETRVIPARLRGTRASGAEAEILLIRPHLTTGAASDAGTARAGQPPEKVWEALVRPGSKLKPGKRVCIATDFEVAILDSTPEGGRIVRLETPLPVSEALARYGEVPLPPYLEREPEPRDAERYQTVYARVDGSVAAPTAGLHLTGALLDALEARGVRVVRLVLHVGPGTFRPVEEEDPSRHPMHAEWYHLSPAAAAALDDVRAGSGGIWAVGTTVARTLETVADERGRIRPGEGWTSLFIRPPYRFRAVDHLITNFHLPRSTLLMLVAALAGHDLIMRAYRDAVAARYRFYSYGDAMVIL